jgi:hypothetical protein
MQKPGSGEFLKWCRELQDLALEVDHFLVKKKYRGCRRLTKNQIDDE